MTGHYSFFLTGQMHCTQQRTAGQPGQKRPAIQYAAPVFIKVPSAGHFWRRCSNYFNFTVGARLLWQQKFS